MSSFVNQLKALAKNFSRRAEPIDPRLFGDELAERTAWTPAVRGGTNIGTHVLKMVPPHRLVFSGTWGATLFTGIFIVIGLAVMGGALGIATAGGGMATEELVGAIFFGLTFSGAGFFMRNHLCSRRTFDRQLGVFWRGRRLPAGVGTRMASDDHVRLETIHALQIIKEYCSTKNGGYYSYELNLILKDASRVNVLDHGKVARLRRDADELAQFLGGIPVWDGSR